MCINTQICYGHFWSRADTHRVLLSGMFPEGTASPFFKSASFCNLVRFQLQRLHTARAFAYLPLYPWRPVGGP